MKREPHLQVFPLLRKENSVPEQPLSHHGHAVKKHTPHPRKSPLPAHPGHCLLPEPPSAVHAVFSVHPTDCAAGQTLQNPSFLQHLSSDGEDFCPLHGLFPLRKEPTAQSSPGIFQGIHCPHRVPSTV